MEPLSQREYLHLAAIVETAGPFIRNNSAPGCKTLCDPMWMATLIARRELEAWAMMYRATIIGTGFTRAQLRDRLGLNRLTYFLSRKFDRMVASHTIRLLRYETHPRKQRYYVLGASQQVHIEHLLRTYANVLYALERLFPRDAQP